MPTSKQADNKQIALPWIKIVFSLLPSIKGMIFWAVVYAFVIELLKILPPFLMKIAIDELVSPLPEAWTVFACIGAVLGTSIIVTLIETRYVLLASTNNFTVETTILKEAHIKMLSLDLDYHESHPSGDLVHMMNKGAQRISELMWYFQDQFLGAFIQIIITSIVLMTVHLGCGLVFLAFMPVVIYQVHRSSLKVQPYRQNYHDKFREASWNMNQSLLNIRTVKDYVQEEKEKRTYLSLLDQYLDLAKIRMRMEIEDTRIRDVILGLGRFAVLFYAVWLVLNGQMTAGSLVLFATLSEKVVSSLFRLGRLYSFLGDSIETIQQFSELFRATPQVTDNPSISPCPKLSGKINFKNVDFEYLKDRAILKDINLLIPAKTSVALVGRSGAGKSTVIKLISRHYDVTGGAIEADDVDIRSFPLFEYRKQIAVVSQHIEIFDTSISDNIGYSSQASHDEIVHVAKMAHIHTFIEGLPDGYKTRVGEKGVKLSGGQRQRIGIARALLAKPAVLVFDEATASLDTESEQMIQHALDEIARQQTVIIIAHRLSTIQKADMIVVFDEGSIVEVGSHTELIERGGIFARMKSLQSLGELRE